MPKVATRGANSVAAAKPLLERFQEEWMKRSTVSQRKAWYRKGGGSKITCTACIKRKTDCASQSDNDNLATTARCSACLTWKTGGCSREEEQKRYRIKSTLKLTDGMFDSLLSEMLKETDRGERAKSNSSSLSSKRYPTRSSSSSLKSGDNPTTKNSQSGSGPVTRQQAQAKSLPKNFYHDTVDTTSGDTPKGSRHDDNLSAPSSSSSTTIYIADPKQTNFSQKRDSNTALKNAATSLTLPSTPKRDTLKSELQMHLPANPTSSSKEPNHKRKREPASPDTPTPHPKRHATTAAIIGQGTEADGESSDAAASKSPTLAAMIAFESGEPASITPRRAIVILPKTSFGGADKGPQSKAAPRSVGPNSDTGETSTVRPSPDLSPRPETRSQEAQTTLNPTRTLAVQTDVTANNLQWLHLEEQNIIWQKIVDLGLERRTQSRTIDGLQFDVSMMDIEFQEAELKLLEAQRRCEDLEEQNLHLVRKEKERHAAVSQPIDAEIQVELGKSELEVVKADMEKKLELKDFEIRALVQERVNNQISKVAKHTVDAEMQTVLGPACDCNKPLLLMQGLGEHLDSPRPPSQLESVPGQSDPSETSSNQDFLTSVVHHEKAEYSFINLLRLECEKIRNETLKLIPGERSARVDQRFRDLNSKLLEIANRRLEVAEMLAPWADPNTPEEGDELYADLENAVDGENEMSLLMMHDEDRRSETLGVSADFQLAYPEEKEESITGDTGTCHDNDQIAMDLGIWTGSQSAADQFEEAENEEVSKDEREDEDSNFRGYPH
ncbi:rRNA-processing protein EBP2 [Stygiomarasmius scandens]|uniref:rRNA-processing protein EBP2 n=1 Tax=Marasmiellus scandens TaxID=2682957 RepID=A0ABR1IWK0_9AGAR